MMEKAKVALEASSAESCHGARMIARGGLAEVLDGLEGIFARPPTILVAKGGSKAGFGMAVFRGGDEVWKSAVIIRSGLVEEAA